MTQMDIVIFFLEISVMLFMALLRCHIMGSLRFPVSWSSSLAASFSSRRFLDGLVQLLIECYFQHLVLFFRVRIHHSDLHPFLFIHCRSENNLRLVRNRGIHIE